MEMNAEGELSKDGGDVVMNEAPEDMDGEDCYYTGHKEKSVALIFNHSEFESSGLNSDSQRKSAASNGKRLVALLKRFNFDVRYHLDLNLKELLEGIANVAKEDHRERNCLLVIILTKGGGGELYAKDLQYKDWRIWTAFEATKCPTLVAKPKFFLFQSNEGMDLQSATSLQVLSSKKERTYSSNLVPKCADFFIFHAPVLGQIQSPLSEHENSIFVEELCSQLEQHGSGTDLVTIIMRTSRNLKKRLHRPGMNCVPVRTYTLTKLLYLSEQK